MNTLFIKIIIMSMENLCTLLNEFEEYDKHYAEARWDDILHRELAKDKSHVHIFWIPHKFTDKYIVSNKYGFVQWLINQNKIRPSLVEQWAIVISQQHETWVTERIVRKFWDVENVIKYLSTQREPVHALLILMRDSNA